MTELTQVPASTGPWDLCFEYADQIRPEFFDGVAECPADHRQTFIRCNQEWLFVWIAPFNEGVPSVR